MSRILTGMIVAGMALTGCRNANPPAAAAGAAQKQENAALAPNETGGPRRAVFPWSVVSGGLDSASSMRKAMEADEVVASHYAGLNPAKFKREILTQGRTGYVSYRIRDKVYWTRRMVTLAAGESVLSDGQTTVRGRCGNLVSATPREPVAPAAAEPAEAAMDVPVGEAQLMTSPPLRQELTPSAETFVNPRELAENKEISSVLPSPEPLEPLPPAYVSSGGGSMAFLGGSATGGGAAGLVTPTPATPAATTPEAPLVVTPASTTGVNTLPLESPPPMVLVALSVTPQVPVVPAAPDLIHNLTWEAPYTVTHSSIVPPAFVYFPPGNTPLPPVPPGNPPPINPPPSIYPPAGPPPGGPPPSVPPPPSQPPSTPLPPVPDPPNTAVPEPGAWVLLALGLVGIAVGVIRKKT